MPERVGCAFFDSRGNERRYDRHPGRRGDVWHVVICGGAPGEVLRYGYRVHGPWRQRRASFNPAKLLPTLCAPVEGRTKKIIRCCTADTMNRTTATAAVAPKSVVISVIMTGKMTPRRIRREEKAVIMKLMSKEAPTCIGTPGEIRGTYKALGHRSWWRTSNSLALRRWNCCRWRSLPASRACNVARG